MQIKTYPVAVDESPGGQLEVTNADGDWVNFSFNRAENTLEIVATTTESFVFTKKEAKKLRKWLEWVGA